MGSIPRIPHRSATCHSSLTEPCQLALISTEKRGLSAVSLFSIYETPSVQYRGNARERFPGIIAIIDAGTSIEMRPVDLRLGKVHVAPHRNEVKAFKEG